MYIIYNIHIFDRVYWATADAAYRLLVVGLGWIFYILSVCWTCANICDPFLTHVTYLQLFSPTYYLCMFIRCQKVYFSTTVPNALQREKYIFCLNIKSHLITQIPSYLHVQFATFIQRGTYILIKYFAGNSDYLYSITPL